MDSLLYLMINEGLYTKDGSQQIAFGITENSSAKKRLCDANSRGQNGTFKTPIPFHILEQFRGPREKVKEAEKFLKKHKSNMKTTDGKTAEFLQIKDQKDLKDIINALDLIFYGKIREDQSSFDMISDSPSL
tara:strand:- start:3956 stop:4351 length:396 start_codon:yes stop_codon:yes gene_type:complete